MFDFRVPIAFIGPFLVLHGILASSYAVLQPIWGHSRFEAMFSPSLGGSTVRESQYAEAMFILFYSYSLLLGLLRIYAGVGVIARKDELIRMAQLSYVAESVAYMTLRSQGLVDLGNTVAPAYFTIVGLVVMHFREKPNAHNQGKAF